MEAVLTVSRDMEQKDAGGNGENDSRELHLDGKFKHNAEISRRGIFDPRFSLRGMVAVHGRGGLGFRH